jgi:hypothetical protein
LNSLIAVVSDAELYSTQTIELALVAFDSPNLAGPTSRSSIRRIFPQTPGRSLLVGPLSNRSNSNWVRVRFEQIGRISKSSICSNLVKVRTLLNMFDKEELGLKGVLA